MPDVAGQGVYTPPPPKARHGERIRSKVMRSVDITFQLRKFIIIITTVESVPPTFRFDSGTGGMSCTVARINSYFPLMEKNL